MTDLTSDLVARTPRAQDFDQDRRRTREADTTTTQRVVDAIAKAELFWILVPKELGGAEAPLNDVLEVFEELAYADGSTGWSVMANITTSCFAAIYTSDDASAAMFPAGALGIHAGMLGPVGTARAADGGFVVSGHYQFGSGCAHADVVRRRRPGDRRTGERAHRRRGSARDARRLPAPGSGRVARQLGRARPRGHRELRLRGRRAVRRGRLHVPTARGRARRGGPGSVIFFVATTYCYGSTRSDERRGENFLGGSGIQPGHRPGQRGGAPLGERRRAPRRGRR